MARSVASNRNLHDMFQNRADNGMSETTLDENLALAYAQGDIGDEEFMNSRHFDTNGSFKLANQLHQQTIQMMSCGGNPEALFGYAVTTEEMFRSGKAFAGSEHAGSDTYEDRVALFTEGLQTQLGTDTFINANSIGGGGIFDSESHIGRRILENGSDLRLAYAMSGHDITLVSDVYTSQLKVQAIAGQLDTGVEGVYAHQFNRASNTYVKQLTALSQTDIIQGLSFEINTNLAGSGTLADPYAPMANATLTGKFRYRIVLDDMTSIEANKNMAKEHPGIDLYDPTDYRFYSTFEGELELTKWINGSKGFGISLTSTEDDSKYVEYYHSNSDSLDYFAKAFLTGNGVVPGGVAIGSTGDGYYGEGTGPHLHFEYYSNRVQKSPLSLDNSTNFYNTESSYAKNLSGFDAIPDYTSQSILEAVEATGTSNFKSYTQTHFGYEFDDLVSLNSYLRNLRIQNQSSMYNWGQY